MSNVFSAKKKTGRPRIDSEAVNVRFPRSTLEIIDAWIARRPDPKPTRPEVIREAIVALEKLGGFSE